MSFTTQVTKLEERPIPKIWLAKPDFTIIERLNGVENLNGKFNYMNQNEISFDVNSHLYDEFTNEEYKNPAIHLIKNKYLIKFTYNNQTEWFVIDDRADVSEEKEYVPVTARFIGSELDKKWIGDIEEIGVTAGSLFNKFLPIVAPNWSVRDIDPKIADVKREYTTSDSSISTLIEQVCELTDAVVIFHNKEREFSLLHRDNAGQFKGLKIKESTYLKGFNDKTDSKDLTTRLVPFGKEGLTINSVNPAGTSYIEDFSYYMAPFKRDSNRNVIQHSDYMSDALCHALLDFEEYFEGKREEYEGVSDEYSALLTEELEEEFKLTELSAILQRLEDRVEVLKPQGNYVEKRVMGDTTFNMDYNMYYYLVIKNQGSAAKIKFNGEEKLLSADSYHHIKIKTPEQATPNDESLVYELNVLAANPNLVAALSTSSKEDYEEEDIIEIEKKYNIYKYQELYDYQVSVVAAVERRLKKYENQKESINSSLDVNTFFPPSLVKERENFVSWGVWREENHTEPKELLEDALKELKKSNNVERTTDLTVVDFLQSLEDKENWDKLSAGDKIRFSNETYEKKYEAFISELNINFDEHDVTVTVSDVIDLKQRGLGISQKLASFVSTSNQVSLHGKQIGDAMDKSNEVMALIEGEWDANSRRITAANETVTIDNRGIIIKSPTHPNEMLVAVAGLIAISNDGGETFKQAINTRGVVAERLIGKVLIGTELVMENDSGTFRFDNDGVRINASNFHLIADDGENYFDKLMAQMQQEIVTSEEHIKEEIENQKESLQGEISDVEGSLTNYTTELINALADGILTKQEIHALQLRLNMLEAEYAQVRRRIMPIIYDKVVDPATQQTLFTVFMNFEEDYEKLLDFIKALDAPTEVPQETIDGISALMERFRPNLEELLLLIDASLEEAQENRIANAEYNTKQFSERLVEDLNDEVTDLKDSLGNLDAIMDEALTDGILTTVEKAQLRDALMRLESEKEDVDNRFGITYVHPHLEDKAEKSELANAKNAYNTAYNSLITKVNQILSLETVTHALIQEYETKYKAFSESVVVYSEIYEKAVEAVQKGYADTAEGEAKKYADGLQAEVQADVKDIQDNVGDFQTDVYGAFRDGIITDQERNRLGIHHDMLEKEKSDLIERYDTIITSNYLQGFYDTEKLVRTRSDYGVVHADLLLAIELAMMDSKITKEESEEATRLFEEYTVLLTAFSVELELAIAAIGEAKAVAFTNEELKNYIELSVFNDEIAQMQAVLDGHITTHYYDHTPTLSNLPASEWATAKDKDNHIGDLFYNSEDGFAYRFMKEGSVYKWVVIKDSEVTKALKDAEDALDLADNKRRVFVATPTVPYDIGDLWIKDDGELMRARTEKGAGGAFSEIDWVIATKYTDDTRANQVGNQLTGYMEDNNAEIKDLRETLGSFQKTVNGTFKDGIIAEYELKILKTQMQALDREKADVDSGYNQLLAHPNLSGTPKTRLQNAYTDFAETHNNLTAKINQVVEDGTITDTEYEDTMVLLDSYPIKLTTYKTVMNDTYLMLIEQAKKAADDALDGVGRYDEWKSSYFTTDVEGIASRVGESSWETTWKPEVKEEVSGIGSDNLIPYSSIVDYVDQWNAIGTNVQLIAPSSGNAAYDKTLRIYTSSIDPESYLGVRSKPLVKDVVKGETYTLSFKTTNHASSYTDMRYVYLMQEKSGTSNQGLYSQIITTDIRRADDEAAFHHTVTFDASFSGRASVMIATRSTSDIAAQFHLYEPIFVQGSSAPVWSSSPSDTVSDFYNTEIKSNYSTTEQTKNLLGSYVTDLEMQGNLDKIATYHQVFTASHTNWVSLEEANGQPFDDRFSYEITVQTQGKDDTLLVMVLSSRGAGNRWDREILERKGSTSYHPQIYTTTSGDVRLRSYDWENNYDFDVIYTKYNGSFTNLNYANSKIEQTAHDIGLRVSNIQSGQKNLIPHTDFVESDVRNKWNSLTPASKGLTWGNYLLVNGKEDISFMGIFSPEFTTSLIAGRPITLSFLGAHDNGLEDFNRIALHDIDNDGYDWFTKNTGYKMEYTRLEHSHNSSYHFNHGLYTLTMTPTFSGRARILIGGYIGSGSTTGWFRITNIQVENSPVASSYSPAPEDTLERFSQLEITADGISSEVSKKVGTNEIISKINQSAEGIRINANRLSIDASNLEIDASSINIRANKDFQNLDDKTDSTQKQLENLEIGGANILKATTITQENSDNMSTKGGTTSSVVSISDGRFFQLRTKTSNTYYALLNFGSTNYFTIRKGRNYVLSFIGYSSLTSNNFDYVYLMRADGGNQGSLSYTTEDIPNASSANLKRYIFKFTANWSSDSAYILIGARTGSSYEDTSHARWFRFKEAQLEQGTIATSWSPSLRDYPERNRIVSAINLDSSGANISGNKINLVGDVEMASGNTRITNLDFNRATATGGSGSSTLKLSGDTIELEGRYSRTWRGTTRTEDVFTRMRNGHLRFRNNSQNRSLYYSDFGISTYVDGEGDGDSSGTLSFFDHTYSTARGVTLHSTYGVAALKSEDNSVIIESGKDAYAYVVSERLRVIRNHDRKDSLSELQFSDGLANSIRVTDDRADFYIGVSTNELRVTNNLRYNSGNIGWQPVHAGSFQSEHSVVMASHSGGNAYYGVGGYEMRVTNNNGYNGGNTGWRAVRASQFLPPSHEDYKESIAPWDYDALQVIKDTQLYKYKLKNSSEGERGLYRHGLVIGDSYDTPVELIGSEHDSIDLYEMSTWSMRGIQQLAQENDKLKERLSESESKNQELEERLNKIEEMLLNQ